MLALLLTLALSGQPGLSEQAQRKIAQHVAIDAAMCTAGVAGDWLTTERALQRPGTTDLNPLARTSDGRAVWMVTRQALCITTTTLARVTGRERLATWLRWLYAAVSAVVIVNNALVAR